MYRCQLCRAVLPAGTPEGKVVVERRPKTYEARETGTTRVGGRPGRFGAFRKAVKYDRGGQGWEIAKEISVCPELAQACAEHPEQLDLSLRACPFRSGQK